MCCKQSKEAPFNPYVCVPKYRSSDALPAPESFFFWEEHILQNNSFVEKDYSDVLFLEKEIYKISRRIEMVSELSV